MPWQNPQRNTSLSRRTEPYRAPFDPACEPPVWAISALYAEEDGASGYHPPALEFEQMALSAMLCLNREATTRGMERLHARHFRWEHHRWIFESIHRIDRRRQVDVRFSEILRSIDAVAVFADLDARGHGAGEAWGGTPLSYLLNLSGLCPSALNIDFYIDRVIEFSKRRHLWELGLILQKLAVQPEADSARLLAALGNAQSQIAEYGWCDWTRTFGETK